MPRTLTTVVTLTLLFAGTIRAQSVGETQSKAAIGGRSLIAAPDRNADGCLNADKCPASLSPSFARFDLDRDVKRGRVVADSIVTVADDFIVDLWHNGEKVPDAKRTLLDEVFGATVERIDLVVREGGWLVFKAVYNRIRWDGVSYFGAAGLKARQGACFVSEVAGGRWSACDDPEQVAAFVASPTHLAHRAVKAIERKWDQGDSRMNSLVDGWKGEAVWGSSRNTWIKFVAPRPDGR